MYLLPKYRKVWLASAAVLLFLFAALRHSSVGRDYEVYADTFRTVVASRFDTLLLLFYEPSFFVFPVIFSSLGYEPVVPSIICFAFLGVFTKVFSLSISPSLSLSILLYVSSFFLLHEMTQIRVGVASGIFLVALKYLKSGDKVKYTFLILLATLFHYSSLLYLLVLFFTPTKRSYLLLFVALIYFIIDAYFRIDLTTRIGLTTITPKSEFYVEVIEGGFENEINIFNYNIFIALLLLVLLWFGRSKIVPQDFFFHLVLKIHLLSLIFYFAFSSTAIFAMRLYELFGVIQMILFAYVIYFSRLWRFAGVALVLLISFLNFLNFTVINSIFNDYKTIFSP